MEELTESQINELAQPKNIEAYREYLRASREHLQETLRSYTEHIEEEQGLLLDPQMLKATGHFARSTWQDQVGNQIQHKIRLKLDELARRVLDLSYYQEGLDPEKLTQAQKDSIHISYVNITAIKGEITRLRDALGVLWNSQEDAVRWLGDQHEAIANTHHIKLPARSHSSRIGIFPPDAIPADTASHVRHAPEW